jgi:hypothetical protein
MNFSLGLAGPFESAIYQLNQKWRGYFNVRTPEVLAATFAWWAVGRRTGLDGSARQLRDVDYV